MTAVLKASDWPNDQLSSVLQLDSHKALCMEYHVCTSISIQFHVCECTCNMSCIVDCRSSEPVCPAIAGPLSASDTGLSK